MIFSVCLEILFSFSSCRRLVFPFFPPSYGGICLNAMHQFGLFVYQQALKRHKRKLERKHNSTRLTIDLELFKEACTNYERARTRAKKEYYTNKVIDSMNDQSTIFAMVNKLLHQSSGSPLPSYNSASTLAEEFAEFFDNKIVKINCHLDSITLVEPNQIVIEETSDSHLNSFTPVTESEIN